MQARPLATCHHTTLHLRSAPSFWRARILITPRRASLDTLVQTMPRKRSAVGVVDGTTSVSSSASTDFVAPGGGSRTDLEHLASTLGLSVDACLAIMNCEGQVRHYILLSFFVPSTRATGISIIVPFFSCVLYFHNHIISFLFSHCGFTKKKINIGHFTGGRTTEYYRRCILWTTRNRSSNGECMG